MTLHRAFAREFLALICFLLASVPALAGDEWRPIDPAHLALKAPVVESDADAEVIFWDVQVDFSVDKTVFANYVRIKIFTERGKELMGKVELPYSSRNKIEDVAGRTIKADGAIVELKKESIFDDTLVKLRRTRISAKTFAMPAVEPGVIIEYRWRETRHNSAGAFARLVFQRDIPIRLIKYTIKTASGTSLRFRGKGFNMANTPMTQEKDGRFSFTMANVHAFHDEPNMPPADQVRSWMLAYYQPSLFVLPIDFDRVVFDETRSKMKVDDDIRRAAQAAIGGASTQDQKLERLFDFCKTRIKNINDDASGLTGDDLAKLKENKTAADTLKRGTGTGQDIDFLFGALANAAGFDARLARLADRGDIFYVPNEYDYFVNLYFLRASNIAVWVGDSWKFFDPAGRYIPFGMLRWQEEGVKALIADPVQTVIVSTPVSTSEKSIQKRSAKLRLSEDGTLEGDVRVEYTGHFAIEKKEENDDESEEQREKSLRDMIKRRMSAAELSNIHVENVADPAKPFVYSFHIRAPGYAQRTGKRLFLQPGFFEKGVGALFSAGERKHAVYFHYSWMEEDRVTIDLPAGFALDNADSPEPFGASNVFDYKVKISVVGDAEALQYERRFRLDGLLFPAAGYNGLKQLFDAVYKSDNHTITLKQNAVSQ